MTGQIVHADLATRLATGIGTHPQPALPDIGVLALVPERWGGTWLSRHQILTRPLRYFNVVWHNPPYEWRQWPRPLAQKDPTPPPADGFAVYDPEPCFRASTARECSIAPPRRRGYPARAAC